MTQVSSLLQLLALAPGIVTFLCLLIAAAFTFKKSNVTKCVVCLSIFFGIITIVCAVVLMLLGDQLLPQLNQAMGGFLDEIAWQCENTLPILKAMYEYLVEMN